MATALQLRRGTTTQHSSFTGLVGEVTVDTDKDTVVVHDGSTAGGFPMARESGTIAKTGSTGSAVLPTGTEAQRDGSPQQGYLRFNTDSDAFEGYDGTAWAPVGGGNKTTQGLWENANAIAANYTIGNNNNALSAGPVTVNSGVTVTVPSGSAWTVV